MIAALVPVAVGTKVEHATDANRYAVGWLRAFARQALAGNRYSIDWQAFADRLGMPFLTAPINAGYWRRRALWLRQRANRKARRA